MLFKLTQRFGADEDGAVTVDWVVLTAAVVGLVGLAMAGLRGNMTSVGQKAGDHVSSLTINTTFN
jgi:Flp pilus assembly pilin Flp